MIQCPICQMINDDMSQFCAECGSRIAAEQAALPQEPPPPSRPRLQSPLLGTAEPPSNIASGNEPGEMARLRKMSAKPEKASEPPINYDVPAPGSPPKNKRLRSPLLASEEFDDLPEEPMPIPQKRPNAKPHHLHSPLLGMGEGNDFADEVDQKELPHTGLHSPLLGSGSVPGGSLRSPLLRGGGSSAFEEYYDEEEYDPYADEDNPNILRSPLLSSKVPLDESRGARKKNEQPMPQAPAAAPQMKPPAPPPPPPPPANLGYPPPPPPPPPPAPPAVQGYMPAPAPSSPPAPAAPSAEGSFEYPDMAQFRRPPEDSLPPTSITPPAAASPQIPSPAPAPAPVPPQPVVPPQASYTSSPPAFPPLPGSAFPPQPGSGFPPLPASGFPPSGFPQATPQSTPSALPPATPSVPPSAPAVAPTPISLKEEPLPVKRGSSRAFDPPQEKEPFSRQAAPDFLPSSDKHASPLGIITGGVALFAGILKAFAVMQYPSNQMQYMPFMLDEVSTVIGLIACGVGLLLSRK